MDGLAVLSSSSRQHRECPRSLPLQEDSTGTNCAPPDTPPTPRSLRGNSVLHVLCGGANTEGTLESYHRVSIFHG